MSQQIIEHVENKYKKGERPQFRVGDTIDVHQRIVEGNRTRTQVFNGVVIACSGGGLTETMTVRRIVNNEGVERIFVVHSPMIEKIEVKRRGKVRRAKLYYLRGRVGKARRLRELRQSRPKKSAAASQPAPTKEAGARQAEPVSV